jgi:cellulose synthase/poly-beta-1,6-N-acetylglucosamine synthase-like glycosyltransferase
MSWLFWISLFIVFYAFVGYALLIALLARFFPKNKPGCTIEITEWPVITLLIPAYNERNYLDDKIQNSLSLDYPKDKLNILFVTDGSDDGSFEYLKSIPQVSVTHQAPRKGKIAAMNRSVQLIQSELIVFSDCNTYLGTNSLKIIASLFHQPSVGCVSGEKRIFNLGSDGASGSGEGFYWSYESWIKRKEAEFNSTIGAAGELFAIRSKLFKWVEEDTLLDDFMISMRIAMQGYQISYHPDAYAIEYASANVHEEMKRKVRIASGSIQAIGRLKSLLNPFAFGWLSFQFISHKVLRWTLAPFLLFLLLPVNISLFIQENEPIYSILFYIQSLIYFLAFCGYILRNKESSYKLLFAPYYFLLMNIAQIKGIFRYLKGKQEVNWEKSLRSSKKQ